MGIYPRYGGVSKLYTCPGCGKYFFVPFATRGGGRNRYVFKKRINNCMIYTCSYSCYHSLFDKKGEIDNKKVKSGR